MRNNSHAVYARKTSPVTLIKERHFPISRGINWNLIFENFLQEYQVNRKPVDITAFVLPPQSGTHNRKKAID